MVARPKKREVYCIAIKVMVLECCLECVNSRNEGACLDSNLFGLRKRTLIEAALLFTSSKGCSYR